MTADEVFSILNARLDAVQQMVEQRSGGGGGGGDVGGMGIGNSPLLASGEVEVLGNSEGSVPASADVLRFLPIGVYSNPEGNYPDDSNVLVHSYPDGNLTLGAYYI